MSTLKFAPIDYAKQLPSVGVSQDLVTKRDLVELKREIIKWMLGIGFAGIVFVAGMLKHMIH
ncbi:MAG TPA: hypothetical protein PLP75_00685 [Burkholderiales bacterium]|nr:hypothetical protein [Burkholderiales bacterium]